MAITDVYDDARVRRSHRVKRAYGYIFFITFGKSKDKKSYERRDYESEVDRNLS